MKTDKIFHKLFAEYPFILFELMGRVNEKDHYHPYKSVEVKEKSLRIDGVLVPLLPSLPLLIVEVQMQFDVRFYRRLFAETMLYLHQQDYAGLWKAIVIFRDRSLEPDKDPAHQVFFDAGFIEVYFIEDLRTDVNEGESLAFDLLRLIIASQTEAVPLAKRVMNLSHNPSSMITEQNLKQVIEMIVFSKFPKLSREEIQAMLALDFDIKNTVIYQQAEMEGMEKGMEKGIAWERKRTIEHIKKVIVKRFGTIPDALLVKIEQATPEQLFDLYGQVILAQSIEELSA